MRITNSRARGHLIGDLSARTGVHIETIRFYERAGIMPKPPRSTGHHRLYDEGHFKRLTFIHRSRGLGFSLDEVRTLLSLVDGLAVTCEDVRSITLQHAEAARQKIADLTKLERILRLAAQCHGDRVPKCPIVDALLSEA